MKTALLMLLVFIVPRSEPECRRGPHAPMMRGRRSHVAAAWEDRGEGDGGDVVRDLGCSSIPLSLTLIRSDVSACLCHSVSLLFNNAKIRPGSKPNSQDSRLRVFGKF